MWYEGDKKEKEGLKILKKVEKQVDGKNGGESEMEGVYEEERWKWVGEGGVVW